LVLKLERRRSKEENILKQITKGKYKFSRIFWKVLEFLDLLKT
jgi:hypothetical protein